jgi:hypothetical protein
VLEPPRLRIGEVGSLELAVVTPPDHAVHPVTPPTEVEGLWILAAETQPVVEEPSRWIHRTVLRVRAREVGTFTFPGIQVAVESADGAITKLSVDPKPIEVVSVLAEVPDRILPYGPRPVPAVESHTAFWGPAAAGALAAFAVVGLVALARRQRRIAADAGARPPAEPRRAAWDVARSDLQGARACDDPFEAADRAHRALRRFVTHRYPCQVTGLTTPELREAEPPFAARSRWPELVDVLTGLDELRFRPADAPGVREALRDGLGPLLDRSDAFVEDSVPPEARA